MFRSKHIAVCLISLVLIFLVASEQSFAAERKPLTWGTTNTTSGNFPYYVFTAKMLNDNIPDINLTVRSTAGGVHNLRMLQKKEVDIGSTPTMNAWEMANGKGGFAGNSYPDIRLLYVIQTNGLQVVVSEKSGIKTLNDLNGKKFSAGPSGGGIEAYMKDILRILGVRPVLYPMSYADSVEAMVDGRIDGVAKMTVPDAMIMTIAAQTKIRILSFTDEERDKFLPHVVGLRKSEYPAGAYPWSDAFKTVDNEWSDYVTKDFPTDLAYRIVKTLWEHRAEVKKTDKAFLADKMMDVTLGVTTNYLHPGTIKFARELGLSVPTRLIPPEMK